MEKHKFGLLFDLAARFSSGGTSGIPVVDMGDDVLEGNEILVRSTNALGKFPEKDTTVCWKILY